MFLILVGKKCADVGEKREKGEGKKSRDSGKETESFVSYMLKFEKKPSFSSRIQERITLLAIRMKEIESSTPQSFKKNFRLNWPKFM